MRSTIDWLTQGMGSDSDYKQMQNSIDNIVKELAEKLRNGEDTSFDKLENKLNILGEEISVSDLIKMQKKSLELSDKLGTIGYGTDKLADNAKLEIIKKQGVAYGDKIGGKLGRLYSSAFAAEVDLHVQKCYDTDSSAEKQIVYGREIYELFFQNTKGSESRLHNILHRYNSSVQGSANIDLIKKQINEFVKMYNYSNPTNYRTQQELNQPKQSEGQTVKNALSIALGSSVATRIFTFLRYALIFDHIFSIGLKSGL